MQKMAGHCGLTLPAISSSYFPTCKLPLFSLLHWKIFKGRGRHLGGMSSHRRGTGTADCQVTSLMHSRAKSILWSDKAGIVQPHMLQGLEVLGQMWTWNRTGWRNRQARDQDKQISKKLPFIFEGRVWMMATYYFQGRETILLPGNL